MAKLKPASVTPMNISEPAAEWVPIESLKPWENNPRKNEGEPVRKVAASIKRFGFASPIIARRENGEIIAGHTRYKAAQKLGLDRVPVRYLDLDPADAHLLAVADNRVGAKAVWDDEMLSAVLNDLRGQGLELSDSGFDEKELDKLLQFGDIMPEDGGSELGEGLSYSVIVTVTNETEQTELLTRLETEGFSCKPLIS